MYFSPVSLIIEPNVTKLFSWSHFGSLGNVFELADY